MYIHITSILIGIFSPSVSIITSMSKFAADATEQAGNGTSAHHLLLGANQIFFPFNGAYFYLMHHKILMNIITYGVQICKSSD